MTIEQKAQRYDEALKRAMRLYEQGTITESLSYIFPELKESEDERTRKEIIRYLKVTSPAMGENIEKMLNWLEKQGETYTKKDIDNAYLEGMAFAKDELEKQNKQILANSAKTCKDEQQPTDNDMKELLHTEYEKGRADAIAEMQKPVDCIDCTNSKGCINCKDGNMKETLVQKPAWSEEDESYLNTTIAYLKDATEFKKTAENCMDWLKSLKDRVQPQPKQEWSEEDESIALGIEQIVNCASLLNVAPDRLNKVRDWLKSLKQRIGG